MIGHREVISCGGALCVGGFLLNPVGGTACLKVSPLLFHLPVPSVQRAKFISATSHTIRSYSCRQHINHVFLEFVFKDNDVYDVDTVCSMAAPRYRAITVGVIQVTTALIYQHYDKMYVYKTENRTFSFHSHCQTLLEAAERTAFPLGQIHGAALLF